MSKEDKRWAILNESFEKTIILLALIEFSTVGVGVIDGIITSRFLGSEAMAAIGIGYPAFCIAGMISGALVSGMQDLCGKEIGRGNFKKFNTISSLTIVMGFVSAIILLLVFLIALKPIVIIFGARDVNSALFALTVDYLKGFMFGIPALITGAILAGAVQLDGSDGLVCVAAVISAVVDIVLDFVAINSGMGIFGVGLAGSIAYYIYVLIVLIHFTKKDKKLHLKLFKRKDLIIMKPLLVSGGAIFVRKFGGFIRPLLINNFFITIGGTLAMTAISIKNNIGQFYDVYGLSVAGAVSLVTSIAVGEKSEEDILHIGEIAHKYSLIGNIILAILVVVFARPIASFYIVGNEEIIDLVVYALYFTGLEVTFNTLIHSRVSYLGAISKPIDSQILELTGTLFAIPIVILMGRRLGVYGAISGFAIASLLVLVFVYILFAFRNKKVKVTVKDYLRLDDSFDISPKDIIELSIRDINDAALASEQVQMFCNGHKFNKKKSFYSALSIEESIRLIYENNININDLAIDLKVIIKGESLIIRLRDNGKLAHPFAGVNSDDKINAGFNNIGIAMLRGIAKKINYFHSLNVNYTIIVV